MKKIIGMMTDSQLKADLLEVEHMADQYRAELLRREQQRPRPQVADIYRSRVFDQIIWIVEDFDEYDEDRYWCRMVDFGARRYGSMRVQFTRANLEDMVKVKVVDDEE